MPDGAAVVIWHRADDEPTLRQAYRESVAMLAGTPGLREMTLRRCAGQPGRYVVVMTWDSLTEFERWEGGAEHRRYRSPLRRFQDRDRAEGHYEIHELVEATTGN